jgi:hypothetical protein
MKKLKAILSGLVSLAMFTPALAFAQSTGVTLNNLSGALTDLARLMDRIIPILIGAAIILFLFGVLKYVFNAGSEDARKEGRTFMIYGIIAIAVMLSVWALVAFVRNTFGVNDVNAPTNLPHVPGVSGTSQ